MIKIVTSEVGREGSYRYILSKGLYMDENRNIYLGGITGSTSYFSNGKIKTIGGSEFKKDIVDYFIAKYDWMILLQFIPHL